MKQMKAIFFDVDSTMYSHQNHDLPESTKQALTKLKEKGYKIAVATSRCRCELDNLPSFFRSFDFDAKIFDGGALVLAKDTCIDQHPIHPLQVEKLVNLSEEEGFTMRYSTMYKDYFDRKSTWRIEDEFFRLYLNIPEVKTYEGEDVFNMLAYIENDEQEKKLRQQLDRCAIVKHSTGTFEITAYGIDKSIGVKKLCEHWGIDMEEVVCFGDGANDVIMLQEAGLGIAMGNGNPKAKEAADIVCGHIDEDGVYKICEELHLF